MIVYRELKKSSLMPVRDAMRRLVAERALEMRPLRTNAIPVLSADQFLEIRAIRLLLEAVTRAANMAKYVPDGDIRDSNYVNSYYSGMVLEHVLQAAGNDLSRENVLRQAPSIKDLELPMLLPGIKVNTGESDHLPVEQLQFMRFTGKQWERFGEVLSTKQRVDIEPHNDVEAGWSDMAISFRPAASLKGLRTVLRVLPLHCSNDGRPRRK